MNVCVAPLRSWQLGKAHLQYECSVLDKLQLGKAHLQYECRVLEKLAVR